MMFLRAIALGFGFGVAVCLFLWLKHSDRRWLLRALAVFAWGIGFSLLFFLVVILDRIVN